MSVLTQEVPGPDMKRVEPLASGGQLSGAFAMNSTRLVLRIVCWTGRILALGLFLFWGAFFLEHVKEWFMHPLQESPPIWVWLAQFVHLAILLGLAALWRWPIAGSLVTVVASLFFFGGLAISAGTAGHRYLPLVVFFAITIIPAVLTLACVLARKRLSNLGKASSASCS
jgi:hypothetical protein